MVTHVIHKGVLPDAPRAEGLIGGASRVEHVRASEDRADGPSTEGLVEEAKQVAAHVVHKGDLADVPRPER